MFDFFEFVANFVKEILMKNTLALILFLVLQFFVLQTNSQVQQEWVKRYNGQNTNVGDWSYAIAIDGFNNIYVTGLLSASSLHDIGTIKYNSSGEQLWVRYYNGTSELQDFGYDIAIDNQHNVYITGQSYDTANRDFVIIKYDTEGNFIWDRRHFGRGVKILVDNENDIIAVGGNSDMLKIVKYNSNGFLMWENDFMPPESFSNYVSDVKIDNENFIYIGAISDFSGSKEDYLTVKLDAGGSVKWYRTFNGLLNYDDQLSKIEVANSGSVYVTGRAQNKLDLRDYVTLKYSKTGDLIWINTFKWDSASNDFGRLIALDSNENIYVIGNSIKQAQLTTRNSHVLKYDSSGAILWVKELSENNSNLQATSCIYKNNSLYFTGGIFGESFGNFKTVKLSNSGELEWSIEYDGGNNDWAEDMVLDDQNNVYVTGISIGSGSREDYLTIKYSQIIGIQPISTEIPNTFSLSQNYPNPFNPSTRIKFAIPKSSFSELIVYDVLGRQVNSLVSEELKAGIYEAEFNASDFPSGVYFYRITAGEFLETKKMILIK